MPKAPSLLVSSEINLNPLSPCPKNKKSADSPPYPLVADIIGEQRFIFSSSPADVYLPFSAYQADVLLVEGNLVKAIFSRMAK